MNNHIEWQSNINIKDGFDVVIGNPPYISHDKFSINEKSDYKNNFSSYAPFADLYCYFIEKSTNILKDKGVFSLITSNSFLKSDYGWKLRKFLSEITIDKLLNIESSQLFDDAIVNVLILNVIKTKSSIKALVLNESYDLSKNFFEFVKSNSFFIKQNNFSFKDWILISQDKIDIYNKIKNNHKTLENLNTKIRLGLATGDNNAFIVNLEQRKDFISKNSKNRDIIKPILRGRDISKYSYKFKDLYIILTKNGVNVERDYPDIFEYFNSLGDKFKKRGAKGQHWTNLRACSFFDDFKQPKIIWIELTDSGRFSLCNEEFYLLNSAYFLVPPNTIDSKYLLSILNSKAIQFFLSCVAETSGMGTLRWINNYVKDFPIPEISLEKQQPLISLVDQILEKKKLGENTQDFEDQIDQMVYELYELTPEEIDIVEKI